MLANSATRATALLLLLTLIFLSLGCDGASGPDGSNAEQEDLVAPEVRFLSPRPNTIVTQDTLRLEVEIVDGTEDLHHVEFLVNGSPDLGYDSAVAYSPPYSYLLDLSQANVEYGAVILGLEAVDTLGNRASGSSLVITYLSPESTLTVETWSIQGTSDYLGIPLLLNYTLNDTTQIETTYRTLVAPFPITRTSPMDSVGVRLTTKPGSWPGLSDFEVLLFDNANGAPGMLLDSLRVTPDPLNVELWQVVDLTTWSGGVSSHIIELGDTVFVGIRTPHTYTEATTSGVDLTMTLRNADLPQSGWGSLWIYLENDTTEIGWTRAVDLDTTVVIYPHIELYLGPGLE